MLQLYIGNKNYSSWSLRPWVLMRQTGIPFEERVVRFDSFDAGSSFKQTIGTVNPVGKVPVLVDEGFAIWDSLAIAETLAERHPGRGLWPDDARQRARARSLTAEMHSGYGALREHCPMNVEAVLPDVGARVLAEQPGVRADLARLCEAWGDALAASGGPMLFGGFGIVDAFFAPVCLRLRSYALPVPEAIAAYRDRVIALAAMQEWIAAALAERDFLSFEEPYRQAAP